MMTVRLAILAMLGVSDGAQAVGSLELGQFALESDFDPEQGFAALDLWAHIEEDRRATSGGFAVFEAFPVDEVPFGSFCGASYGFSVLDPVAQTASKLFLGYATFDRANLYIVTAFYDEEQAAERGFRDEASLQTYAPYLEQLVERLRMPP